MQIKVKGIGRTFQCVLHFAAYSGLNLLAASFAGPATSVWGVSSNIMNGRDVSILDEESEIRLYPVKGMYKSIEKKSGDVYHCLIFHKSALLNEDFTRPTIIAPDGDIRKATGRYITTKFAVPVEWEMDYLDILNYTEAIIVQSPYMDIWRNLRVIEITSVKGTGKPGLTDETLIQGIEKALSDGTLKIPESSAEGKFDPGWTMREYLKANARILANQVKSVRPRHDPEKDKLHPAIGQMERIPFPAQAHVIQGLVNTLKQQNMAIASGDMGTGKSIIAIGVVNILHHEKGKGPMPVLLSAPGITIPKWEKKEIPETLPDAKTYVIRSTEDALRYFRKVREGYKPEGLEFVLVSIDRAKLGPEPWCSATWKRVAGTKEYAWHCPNCGDPIPDPNPKKEDYLRWNGFACGSPPTKRKNLLPNGLPEGFIPKWKLPNKIKKCPQCGSPLWRPALKSRGETKNRPRWYVSQILKKLRRYFDIFIMDEVHQTKASDSGRGDAFAQMVKAGKKTLCLTGTLVNGMSTSIKELLWRTDPKSLLREGFDHKTGIVGWAKRYGVLEKVIRTDEEDEGIITRRKKREAQPREKPGIAPELVANHLLHRAAFLELSDLGLPLIELKEIPKIITMDDEHLEEYKRFHNKLYNTCAHAYVNKVRGAFAKFIPATINYADRPDMGAEVEIKNGKKTWDVVYAPAFDPDYYHAKERELVNIVKENLEEDRGCVIYCNYTDTFGTHHRLKQVLEAHGIESYILESHVSPEKRVEWLSQREEAGDKVIICNMRLVETGLDLLPWPTLIFYQLNYDINTVRQASRRAWRIGQTRECRVYYLVYDGTQQMAQFQTCMLKRAHALLAEGRLDRSELASFGRDSHSSLTADLADCLADEDTAEKWKELARKDMDIETVEESKFMEILNKTKVKLARETLRLCGMTADEIDEVIDEEEVERPTILDLEAFLPKRKKKKRKKKVPEGYVQLSLFEMSI